MQKVELEEYKAEEKEVENIMDVLQDLEEDEENEDEDSAPREYNLLSSLDRVSDQYQESTEYTTPYDNYGLERSLAIYLREIGRQSLLTKADEVFLFSQIEKGQQIIQEAISETQLELDPLVDDMDEANMEQYESYNKFI